MQPKPSDFFYEPSFIDNNNIHYSVPVNYVKTLTVEGVLNSKVYLVIDSVSSKFKITERPEIKIVVKCNTSTVQGSIKNLFRLFQLPVNRKENNRRVLITSNKHFINSISNYNTGLPISFSKVSDNTYMLVFENLSKGEYAIIISGSVYSFSVI